MKFGMFKEKPVKLKCFKKLNFLFKITNARSRENTAIVVGKLKKVNEFHLPCCEYKSLAF
jgi:hypothetical protein